LADTGITTGWQDNTFRPENPISREAFAAFLYRFSHDGSDAGPCLGGAPFVDVRPGSPFCGAIAWLAVARISTGYGDGTFRPTNSISREAFARMLHHHDVLGT